MSYAEKLKDPRWQRKRLEILNRDNFRCRCCGDDTTTLNVHHKSYFGEPWEAPNKSLVTLCEPCHKEESESINVKIKECISELKHNGFTSDSFSKLSNVFKTDRGWDYYEPVFDILKMAIDDDAIWGTLHELYFERLSKRHANKWF